MQIASITFYPWPAVHASVISCFHEHQYLAINWNNILIKCPWKCNAGQQQVNRFFADFFRHKEGWSSFIKCKLILFTDSPTKQCKVSFGNLFVLLVLLFLYQGGNYLTSTPDRTLVLGMTRKRFNRKATPPTVFPLESRKIHQSFICTFYHSLAHTKVLLAHWKCQFWSYGNHWDIGMQPISQVQMEDRSLHFSLVCFRQGYDENLRKWQVRQTWQ